MLPPAHTRPWGWPQAHHEHHTPLSCTLSPNPGFFQPPANSSQNLGKGGEPSRRDPSVHDLHPPTHLDLLQEGQLLGDQMAPSSFTGQLTTPHTWSGIHPSRNPSLIIHSPVIPKPQYVPPMTVAGVGEGPPRRASDLRGRQTLNRPRRKSPQRGWGGKEQEGEIFGGKARQ